MGHYRFSLVTDRLTATMQTAKRIYSLAQGQNDAALLIGAYRALASTLYFIGDFRYARQHALRAVEIWRSGVPQSAVEEVIAPAVGSLCFDALSQWHLAQIASCKETMAEAISLAKELNHMHALAVALCFAGFLGQFERNPADVERWTSDLIELSTRQHFTFWLHAGETLRGWARSVAGDTTEGIAWIEEGIENMRAGERVVERSEERWWSAELRRLSGVFLTALGTEEAQIDAAFCEAIRIAREQDSLSLEKRAEETYAEYRRHKASRPEGRGFRLAFWVPSD
jgi:hypothetical protein